MQKSLMQTGFVSLIVILVLIPGSLSAQEKTKGYAGLGLGIPSSSELSDHWKTGFHGFVGVGLPLDPALYLVPKMEFHSFWTDNGNIGAKDIENPNLQIMLIGLGVRFSPVVSKTLVKPYILMEAGLSRIYFPGSSGVGEGMPIAVDETEFYGGGGVGLEFMLTHSTSFFLQVRILSTTSTDINVDIIPVTLGVAIDY